MERMLAMRFRSMGTAFSVCLFFALLPAGRTEAVDFLRGDLNGDGQVTISDAAYSVSFLFMGGPKPECFSSGDADGSHKLDLTDAIVILQYLFLGGAPLPSPFPAVGPGLEGDMACDSYGNGETVEDPAAELSVGSALAPGGSNRLATIRIAFSSSKEIAGYSFRIADTAGVLDPNSFREEIWDCNYLVDLSGCKMKEGGWLSGRLVGGKLDVGALTSLMKMKTIPIGDDTPILEIRGCLNPGTKAGEYPLTLEAGELVSAGSQSAPFSARGLAIQPALASGVLVVASDVAEVSSCENCGPGEPPQDINILFKLGDGSGAPGASVKMPFTVMADRPSTGFSYSIDFDEGVLDAVSVSKLWHKPSGTPYEFEVFDMNNRDDSPGSAGVDEGYIVGAAIISLTDTGDVLPPDAEVPVYEFELRVRDAAPAGQTELRFIDGGQQSGGAVANRLIAGGVSITPALASSFVFVNGRVNIIPDGTVFVRGDSDASGLIDMTDAVVVLAHLFQGAPPPVCMDAADANDDGRIDITDPIVTLSSLYLQAGPLPPPTSESPDFDPTPDTLICRGSL
jgi:hypothetical protein